MLCQTSLFLLLDINKKFTETWASTKEGVFTAHTNATHINQARDDIHLSFVVATRMESYGGDSSKRFKTCISTLVEQLKIVTRETRKRAEIIVVEWNPVPSNVRVHEFLGNFYSLKPIMPFSVGREKTWPITPNSSLVELRVITVPISLSEAHGLDQFMEYHAKNVGIRRARGKWTLTFNQDVLFTFALLRVLLIGNLHPRAMYRTDLLQFTQSSFLKAGGNVSALKGNDKDVALAHTQVLMNHEIVEYGSDNACKFSCNEEENPRFKNHPNITSQRFQDKCRFVFGQSSGDFEMATTAAWHDVGGFYESKGNYHVDSYQILRFLSHGYKQVIFDRGCNVLHQSHVQGRSHRSFGIDWGWMAPFEKCIKKRTQAVAAQMASSVFTPEPPELCAPADNSMEFGYVHHQFEEFRFCAIL